MTFSELSMIWLTYKSYTIKKTSFIQYKRIIENYLNVYLGEMNVYYFTIQDILECIEKMKIHLSCKTLQDNIVALKGIIKYGNMLGYCQIPIEGIPNIKYSKREVQILKDYEL